MKPKMALVMGIMIVMAGSVVAVFVYNTLLSEDVPIVLGTIEIAWETPVFESALAIPIELKVTTESTADTGDSTDWFYSLTRSFNGVEIYTTVGICAYTADNTSVIISPTDFKVNVYAESSMVSAWAFYTEPVIDQSGDCVTMSYASPYDVTGYSWMYKIETFVHDSIDATVTDLEVTIVANT